MNQPESEVERTARAVRKWGRIALIASLGCGGLGVLVGLVLLALVILVPTCVFG